jgi:hypothetical protein
MARASTSGRTANGSEALEHMTLLWVQMVRAKGGSPNLVWAALRRPRSAEGA